ncbi:MAG: 7-carboxy-7-deazaguanine synthase QueE [Candidatus Marinimicrobia bacterium]|nr:7-carboxy-7-deazaguanine synthase QueE [Candidatus Neomarinimicrobiota bacterium]
MGISDKSSDIFRINDIFYSVQAEGFLTGTATIFIRFSDCNLRCDFCDTEFLTGVDMNIPEILNNIENFPTQYVILTGGEPLLNDTTKLVQILKKKKYKVGVETNGMFAPQHDFFDWVTVSPKNKDIKIKKCDEVKCVIGIDEIPNDYNIEADHYFVTPKNPTHDKDIGTESASFFDRNVAKYCSDYVKKNPKWKLTLQTNKIIGIL